MRREVKNAFDRTFYVIDHNKDLDVLDTLWYGYASQKDLRTACEVGLEVLEKTKCSYKLNDNTGLAGPWEEAVSWLEKEWLPRAYQSGLRYLAHIAPHHSFGEAAGEAMEHGEIGSKLIYKMFLSRAEALAWLKTCQQKHKQQDKQE